MKFEDITALALHSSPMPVESSQSELLAYQQMNSLYEQHRSGLIDKETAAKRKTQYEKAYQTAQQTEERNRNLFWGMQENIRIANGCKIDILKNATPDNAPEMLVKAMECICRMTGEMASFEAFKRKWEGR